MLKFNEFINENINQKGYWVFEPKDGFSRPTIKYPYPRYTKEESIKLIFNDKNEPQQYKEPYYEEEIDRNTISFKDERSNNEFINWLRYNKNYDGDEDDLKSYYSSTELDYLYQEFTENN